jgi:hypothetical protein
MVELTVEAQQTVVSWEVLDQYLLNYRNSSF